MSLRDIQDRADHRWEDTIDQLVSGRSVIGRNIQIHGRMRRTLDQGQLFGASTPHGLGRCGKRWDIADQVAPIMNGARQVSNGLTQYRWKWRSNR